MKTTITERYLFGTIEVPTNRRRGARTQHSLIMEMECDQWVQPEKMLRLEAKRLSPD